MAKSIEALAERADFGPAYDGENYVTLTFRVRKDQAAIPGIWDLTPRCPGTLDWAITKYPEKAEARENATMADPQVVKAEVRHVPSIRAYGSAGSLG